MTSNPLTPRTNESPHLGGIFAPSISLIYEATRTIYDATINDDVRGCCCDALVVSRTNLQNARLLAAPIDLVLLPCQSVLVTVNERGGKGESERRVGEAMVAMGNCAGQQKT